MPDTFRCKLAVTNLTSCARTRRNYDSFPFAERLRARKSRADNFNRSFHDDGGWNEKKYFYHVDNSFIRLSRRECDVMTARFWNDRVNDVYVAIHLCNECVVHFHGYPFSSRPCQISRANGPDVYTRSFTCACTPCHYKTYFNNIDTYILVDAGNRPTHMGPVSQV